MSHLLEIDQWPVSNEEGRRVAAALVEDCTCVECREEFGHTETCSQYVAPREPAKCSRCGLSLGPALSCDDPTCYAESIVGKYDRWSREMYSSDRLAGATEAV